MFLRFEAIYGHAWTSRHSDRIAWQITKDEWSIGLADIDTSFIKKALDELRTQGNQFPPALPEFIKLCRKQANIPDEQTAYQMALRRDFSHPIALMCYQKIGSWDFTHDSDKELRRKFASTYKYYEKMIPLNQKMIEDKS